MRAKRSTREIFRCAWRDWSEDNASCLAAALAYYTALSLASLVVLGVVLLKFIGFDGREVIEQQMAMLLGGAGREMAREMIRSAHAFGAEFTQEHAQARGARIAYDADVIADARAAE